MYAKLTDFPHTAALPPRKTRYFHYLCRKSNPSIMADDYIGRKMEDFRARAATPAARPAASLTKLLRRNRSHRGYDAGFKVRPDQLRKIIEVNTLTPSARNAQSLRFLPVLGDQAAKVTGCMRLGGALPELHLPLPGTEPNAYIIVCSAAEQGADLFIDLGISAQSMLLRATEMGLNGICIRAFDRMRIREIFSLDCEPLLILAIGRGTDRIELVDIRSQDDRRYYRVDGVHYVPKLTVDDLIIE